MSFDMHHFFRRLEVILYYRGPSFLNRLRTTSKDLIIHALEPFHDNLGTFVSSDHLISVRLWTRVVRRSFFQLFRIITLVLLVISLIRLILGTHLRERSHITSARVGG